MLEGTQIFGWVERVPRSADALDCTGLIANYGEVVPDLARLTRDGSDDGGACRLQLPLSDSPFPLHGVGDSDGDDADEEERVRTKAGQGMLF